jgi:predicted nucleotidyltransferase
MEDPAIAKARAVLTARPHVRLALAFGSRARGAARADSDLDIAVDGEGIDVLALARDLSLACGCEVDAVDLGGAGYPLLQALLRDAIVVHQGERGAAARWRSHTIASVETDRPWWERMRDAFLEDTAGGAR